MFHTKILRSFICLNSAGGSGILKGRQSLPKQFLNIRYMYSYKRDWDNQNSAQVSRTLICHKYIRLIKNSIRDSGAILELNPKMSNLIDSAKKINLPPEFIQFAIRISSDIRARTGLYDVLLPNGFHFLIQYEDIETTITKHHLLKLCEKYDGALLQGETVWPRSFFQKGIILAEHKESDKFSNVSKDAISKIGVQSFHKETDVEGVTYWKFYCDPWKLPDVKTQLNEITSVEEAYIGYVPKKKSAPSQYLRKNILNIFSKLSEVPTIDNVFINANII